MTVKELSEKRGIKPASLSKTLSRNGFKVGVNDLVNSKMLEVLNGSKPVKVNGNAPVQINGTKSKLVPKDRKPKSSKRNDPTGLFSNHAVILAAASILIASDAMSFAWIAINTYINFKEIAGVIFALVGMAVGYSAIKNIISYKGWNGDAWAAGFGVFQIALHLCAMEVFTEYSFFIGKIVIATGIALATGGLAVSLKEAK